MTLDALIALIGAFIVSFIVMQQFWDTSIEAVNAQQLQDKAYEVLQSAYFNHVLSSVIENPSSLILDTHLNATLDRRLCGKIIIANSTQIIKEQIQTGCTSSVRVQAVAYRSIVTGGNNYYAKAFIWYEGR